MYISTENNKVLKTITNGKQRQPLRGKIMLSVPITCSVTECFCPIRHSATLFPHPPPPQYTYIVLYKVIQTFYTYNGCCKSSYRSISLILGGDMYYIRV